MKKMYVVKLVAVGVFLLIASYADSSTILKTKVERVVIFKDGYAMITKEVTGNLDAERKATIELMSLSMVLGSSWFSSEAANLSSIVSRQRIVTRAGHNETEKEIELEFPAKMPTGPVKLSWSYFGPGIRWIPTYRLSLKDAGKAELEFQAEILNEMEDINSVPVDLVVGIPNFRFKDVVSPLTLQPNLVNPLQQTAPQLMGQSMSNVLMTQRASDFRGTRAPEETPAAATVPAIPQLGAEGVQDLFVYKVPSLTLKSGERAIIPLLSTGITYRNLYTWNIQLQRAGAENVPGAGGAVSPIKLLKNDIWHQIQIDNTTELPFTTGPVLVMDGNLPVAQELLTYTSAGGKVLVPLTAAIDVRGAYSEEELSRNPQGINFDGQTYARVNKKGSISVTNYKKIPIDLSIECNFGGMCTQASDQGNFIITDFEGGDWASFRGHPALVGHSKVSWDLTLKAGETKKVTCEYYYYTR